MDKVADISGKISFLCRVTRRTRWRDFVSQMAWELLGASPEELVEVTGERLVWVSLSRTLPPQTRPG